MTSQNNLNLRKYHTVFFEIGLIASLLIFIVAMKADFTGKQKPVDFSSEDEVVTIQQVPRTEIKKQQPTPADPVIKAKVPIDDPIEKLTQKPPAKIESQPKEEIFVTVEQEP